MFIMYIYSVVYDNNNFDSIIIILLSNIIYDHKPLSRAFYTTL